MLYQLSYGGDVCCVRPAARGMTLPPATSGAEGSRTPDLSVANAALSQLSYGPVPCDPRALARAGQNGRDRTRTCDLHDVNVAL